MQASSISRVVQVALPYTLGVYAVALLTSMAGMEIFGWLTAFLAFVAGISKLASGPSRSGVIQTIRQHFLIVDWVLLAFFLIVALGATLSPSPSADVLRIIGSVRWIFLFFLLRYALHLTWGPGYKRAFRFLMALSLMIGLYAIIQHFTGIDLIRSTGRAVQLYEKRESGFSLYRSAGLFSSPMTYGNSVGLFLCFLFSAFIFGHGQNRWVRLFVGTSTIVVFFAAVFTMSRGVWLGIVVAALVMTFFLERRLRVAVLAAIVVVFATSYFASNDVASRVQTVLNPAFRSNSERVLIWKMNWEMFRDNPVLGVGYGENESLISDYYRKAGIENGMVGHAHNTFLQVLAGTGIVGFLLFGFFIVYFFVISVRLWRRLSREREWEKTLLLGAIGAQVFMQISGLTECNFKDAEVNHNFMFILALVSVMSLRSVACASHPIEA